MKRIILKIAAVILCIIILLGIYLYHSYPRYDKNKVYVKEYAAGAEGIVGSVDITQFGDEPAYEIGADKNGYAVFKNPEKAFKQMKIDYEKGIKAIKEEYNLLPISKWNFRLYGVYGWQLVKTKDTAAIEQGWMISKFMDIYEDSY